MSEMPRGAVDLSVLPTYAFGSRATPWWGTFSFCLLEGTGFALGIGGYLYLAATSAKWASDAVPLPLFWSGMFTAVLLLSAIPNFLIKRAAIREDLVAVRLLLVGMSLVGMMLI